MAPLPAQCYTSEQYLEIDRKAEGRSEYVSGEILAMAGASREHNRITLNIGASLTEQLSSLGDVLHLSSIGCDLPLAVIYERIESPAAVGRLKG